MEKKTVGQKIYKQLRNDIAYGKFKPGEHLSGRLLTQEYKVSRALLREIIGQLNSQGFLSVVPNRGAIVTKLSLKDIEIIYDILIRCESYATMLFAENWNDSSMKKLKVKNEKMHTNQVKLHQKKWLIMNDEFHELIYSNCGSRIVSNLVHQGRLRIYRFRLLRTELESIEIYNQQHEMILEAISERNGRKAEKLAIKHLSLAKRNRLKALNDFSELI